jgi:hypothetical protein
MLNQKMPSSLHTIILVVLLSSFSQFSVAREFTSIQWVDLIPKSDLDALLNPPESLMAIPDGSPQDVLSGSLAESVEKAIGQSQQELTPEEQAYYAALESRNIRSEYNNQDVRLAGFIVPLEFDDDYVITEFFLVPYFGACIHVPPPPPNQIIHVKYPKGITLEALYDPFWIEGKLKTEVIENDLAVSAYALSADFVKPYQEYQY